MGSIVLGDSAGAHFSFPPNWFDVSEWTNTTFDDLVPRAANEFDLPMMSATTGFVNIPSVRS